MELRESLALYELVIYGEQGQFQAAGYAHLIEDIGQVMLDGVFAESEFLGDFLVAESGNDGSEDFGFAPGDSKTASFGGGQQGGLLTQVLHHVGHGFAANPVEPCNDASDGLEQELGGRFLHDDTPGTHLQSLDD